MIDGEEVQNITKVWAIAIASLFYCYYVVKQIPVGFFRLFSLLPIFYLFTTLPLLLSSTLIGGPTTFYLVWLGNFKLILFAFNRGPLATPLSLSLFISTALMPIKTLATVSKSNAPDGQQKSPINFTAENSKAIQRSFKISGVTFAIKFVILAFILWIYRYREYLHPSVIIVLYCCHVYLGLEMALLLSAVPVRAILGVEIEPLFHEPYLSTSLQDFWGKRWNLMVTSILRPTVYDPVRIFITKTLGRRWSFVPAFMASFLVSGLMHEIMYYYMTRVSPTWEVTWFFVLQGACTACEVAIKKALNGRWRLHPALSGSLSVGFIAVTAAWLFFPQIMRNGVDLKAIEEYKSLSRLLLFSTT